MTDTHLKFERVFQAGIVLFFLLSVWIFCGCGGIDKDIPSAAVLVSGQVSLTWDEYPEAASYNVYLSKAPGITKINTYAIRNIEIPMTIRQLEPGATYYLIVTANTPSGESEPSKEVSFTAAQTLQEIDFGSIFADSSRQNPAQLSGDKEVTLVWDEVDSAAAYNLYWKETPGVTTRNGNKIANVTPPHTVKGLSKDKTYYFVVTAVNAGGESPVSSEITITAE